MALFFVFGPTYYSRWGPIELQDSSDLQRKFPSLHAHFEKGGFVMYMSTKQGSAIAFDMGLEKGYNKPLKQSMASLDTLEEVKLWLFGMC